MTWELKLKFLDFINSSNANLHHKCGAFHKDYLNFSPFSLVDTSWTHGFLRRSYLLLTELSEIYVPNNWFYVRISSFIFIVPVV